MRLLETLRHLLVVVAESRCSFLNDSSFLEVHNPGKGPEVGADSEGEQSEDPHEHVEAAVLSAALAVEASSPDDDEGSEEEGEDQEHGVVALGEGGPLLGGLDGLGVFVLAGCAAAAGEAGHSC